MAWQISGRYWVSCSCEVGCPCFWGEPEGDDGWCSGAMVVQVDRGSLDGVDLSGTNVALDADWPKGFLSGEGRGRIYLDKSASAAQNEALEALVQGKKGGSLEAFSVLIPEFIASKNAAITVERGEEKTNIRVGDMGALTIAPIRNESGAVATVRNAPAAMVEETVLGRGTGSRWQDPDLKRWESRGHAEQGECNWTG